MPTLNDRGAPERPGGARAPPGDAGRRHRRHWPLHDRARQHFLIRADPHNLLGRLEGPLEEMAVAAIDLLQTRAAAMAEGRQRLLGDRILGREPVTRDDYEYRLRVIARAIASTAKEDWQREMQIRRQFDEVADRIRLAAANRKWVLNEERWRLRFNREPTMTHLWVGPTASPSCLRRPRSQDFDPDPAI